jgi:TolB-like protein/Tfp pilus assembly protein PilF
VLPFINRSGLGEDDVFADGMVEDLTAALSASHLMKVVAASATAIYRRGARDLRQIGRDLGVRYLLEGNVRRVGPELRLAAQLVEAESGNILWTQKFDRPLAELSALQEDLAAELAAHLGVQVQHAEMEHALSKRGGLTASETLLLYQAHSRPTSLSGWERIAAEARRAIEIDPNNGQAYSGLAVAQAQLLAFRGGNDPLLARETLDSIRKATTFDPNNPRTIIGIASAMSHIGKLQDAFLLAERAIDLNPKFEGAHTVRGMILARLGRLDEALVELDASERLAPNSYHLNYTWMWRSVVHLRAGRLEMALDAVTRSLRLVPGPENATQGILCLAKMNQWDLARDSLRRLRDADPEISYAHVENIVRDLYDNSSASDELVAIARRVCGEAQSEPKSA